jgi:hypothetical protein
MSIATHPKALEGHLRMLQANIRESVEQIEGGKYPQFDANTRASISESLHWLAQDREEQLELDPAYPCPVLAIPGLHLSHLDGSMTLGDLRRASRFVSIEGVTP